MNFVKLALRLSLVAALAPVALMSACTPPPPPSGAPTVPASGPAAEPVSGPPTAPPPASQVAPPHALSAAELKPGTPSQLRALELAKRALAGGRDREALSHFQTAMTGALNGTSLSASLAAAELLSQRDAEGAAAIYERLLDEARFVPEVQFTAGRFFFVHGRTGSAKRALEASTLLQPDFLPGWVLLGTVQAQAGASIEAAATLTEYERRLNAAVRRANDMVLPPGDRLAALEVLALVDDDRATRALVTALRDPVAGVRVAAAELMAEDGSAEALQALAEAVTSEQDPAMRAALFPFLARAREQALKETRSPLPALPTVAPPAVVPPPVSPPTSSALIK